MDFLTPVLIGIGLPVDCSAVSLAVGSTTLSGLFRGALVIALFFGGFQTGMLVAGWAAGSSGIGYSCIRSPDCLHPAAGCRR
jgi:putative Mn2+ efflux pump MntP